jgi:hypothetical protein
VYFYHQFKNKKKRYLSPKINFKTYFWAWVLVFLAYRSTTYDELMDLGIQYREINPLIIGNRHWVACWRTFQFDGPGLGLVTIVPKRLYFRQNPKTKGLSTYKQKGLKLNTPFSLSRCSVGPTKAWSSISM